MQMNEIMSYLPQIKQNPMQFLLSKRLNIPQGIENDPSAILQHLMKTGQVNQQQVDAAYRFAQQLK